MALLSVLVRLTRSEAQAPSREPLGSLEHAAVPSVPATVLVSHHRLKASPYSPGIPGSPFSFIQPQLNISRCQLVLPENLRSWKPNLCYEGATVFSNDSLVAEEKQAEAGTHCRVSLQRGVPNRRIMREGKPALRRNIGEPNFVPGVVIKMIVMFFHQEPVITQIARECPSQIPICEEYRTRRARRLARTAPPGECPARSSRSRRQVQ